ncbi:hypothetical protein Tco_1175531 [Tanacetum coccineum]
MVNNTTHVLVQSQELQREDVATLCGWMLLLDRQHLKVILRELLHDQVILRELLHDQVILRDLHRISEWQSAQIDLQEIESAQTAKPPLRGKISVLKATMEMHMHPEQHTVNSAALFHEVLNEMEKLDL